MLLIHGPAERFMREAVFAVRRRNAHRIIPPDTASLLAFSNYSNISINIFVLIRPIKICQFTGSDHHFKSVYESSAYAGCMYVCM